MTNYAYTRVSTDRQDLDNQRLAINKYANERKIIISYWVEETISSRKSLNKRLLGNLLTIMKRNDKIIVTEISRLARNMYELAYILQVAINKNVEIISVKENYIFKNDLQSKIMAYAFGLGAEIERSLISSRTKMSLAKLREKNVKLGRPVGTPTKFLKLSCSRQKITQMLQLGFSKKKVATMMEVSITTLSRFLKQENLSEKLKDD